MSTRFIVSHAVAIAAVLSAWLLYESVTNNQAALRLVELQKNVSAKRDLLGAVNARLSAHGARIDAATRLANSIGPAILADLIALSAGGRNPEIAQLLLQHGLGKPDTPTSTPSQDAPSHP